MSETVTNGEKSPLLTIGLPIRNGEKSIPRLIDSVLGQTLGDVELCISDNASSDKTAELCEARARQDPRLRFFRQAQDVGIVENFNSVFRMARGRYFRWIGGDDWLEPGYAASCVATLENAPEAVGVTTYFRLWKDDGSSDYVEYEGPRVDAAEPETRFGQCLRLLLDDFRYFDPMYSTHRTELLRKTALVRPVFRGDQLLAAELSLLGPWCHIPECLANRGYPRFGTQEQLLKLLRPPGHPPLSDAPELVVLELHRILARAGLPSRRSARCYGDLLHFYAEEMKELRVTPVRQALGRVLRRAGLLRKRGGGSPTP